MWVSTPRYLPSSRIKYNWMRLASAVGFAGEGGCGGICKQVDVKVGGGYYRPGLGYIQDRTLRCFALSLLPSSRIMNISGTSRTAG